MEWFVTRTSTTASTDEDRAMARQQLGPFQDRDEARRVFAAHLRDAAYLEVAPSEAAQERVVEHPMTWLEITGHGRERLAEHLRTGLSVATVAEQAGSALYGFLLSFVESLEG